MNSDKLNEDGRLNPLSCVTANTLSTEPSFYPTNRRCQLSHSLPATTRLVHKRQVQSCLNLLSNTFTQYFFSIIKQELVRSSFAYFPNELHRVEFKKYQIRQHFNCREHSTSLTFLLNRKKCLHPFNFPYFFTSFLYVTDTIKRKLEMKDTKRKYLLLFCYNR